ncbi:MAG: hypothetical protein J0M05_14900 [Candidatus Kapabacteria bacterium]|nr:hypothetical protein [Candidatus Kapabacteria bacterium]
MHKASWTITGVMQLILKQPGSFRFRAKRLCYVHLNAGNENSFGTKIKELLHIRDKVMISIEIFETIKQKYGDVASWAVWEDVGAKPKSNMGHLNIFDLQKNPTLLEVLKNNIVMIGLNFSRPVLPTEPFKNFHDLNPRANDFKIRYAFRGTEFYGAYMTDVIKNLEMKDSHDVKTYLKKNPDLVQENILMLRKELSDLHANKPILLAFGVDTYNLLNNNLRKDEYSKLIRLTHYSHQISKENYKEEVIGQIQIMLPTFT